MLPGTRNLAEIDYKLFESRSLELLYKTDAQLTPTYSAYRIGCSVSEATEFLDRMATAGILTIEVDENGTLFYDLNGRPSPSGEPLSWQQGQGSQDVPGSDFKAPVQIQVTNHLPALKPEKSVGLAATLGFLFGPLGMLYSTGQGALTMFLIALMATAVLPGSALLLAPVCAIWAATAANHTNEKRRRELVASATTTTTSLPRQPVLGRLGAPSALPLPPKSSGKSEE